MKKHLRFIYRYITTAKRWHRWFNTQVVLLLFVSCIFLTVLSWSAPFSVDSQHPEVAARRPYAAVGAVAISRDSGQNNLAAVSYMEEAAQVTATPAPEETASATTMSPTPFEPTATPFPPEFAYNSQQTVGLTITATVLVLIVVFGVLLFMPKKTE